MWLSTCPSARIFMLGMEMPWLMFTMNCLSWMSTKLHLHGGWNFINTGMWASYFLIDGKS